MEGLDKRNSAVRQLIIRVSDQLKAGEIKLIEVTPEESSAAKARLDEVRKKRRDRHASKKIKYKWTVIEIKKYSYNNNYSKIEEKSLDNNLKNIICKTGWNIYIR